MGSKGSRRGPLKTPPIKSYSVKGLAHSAGFGVHTKTSTMCQPLNGVTFDRGRFEGPTAAPLRAHGAYFLGKLRKVTSPPL